MVFSSSYFTDEVGSTILLFQQLVFKMKFYEEKIKVHSFKTERIQEKV